MSTELLFNKVARAKMLIGINKLADAVKATLGAKGRNVVIRHPQQGQPPMITKDGVTVATYINLEDKVEDMGCQIIKEASKRTMQLVGDGTTTSTVLAQSLIEEGLKYLDNGANPVDIRKGFEIAFDHAIKHIEKTAVSVKNSSEKIREVGIIAANNDVKLGSIIGDAVMQVGAHGYISVEASYTNETYVHKVDGMKFENGFLSPYFCTNRDKLTVEFEDCRILLYDKKISSAKEILPLLEAILTTIKKPLLIIADDIDSEALALMVINKRRGNMPVCAIKIPGFGNMKYDYLEDIAILTGGEVISETTGNTLQHMKSTQLGTAQKVIIGEKNTIIAGGNGNKEVIEKHIADLTAQLAGENMLSRKYEELKERLSKLTNGMAILYVTPTTNVEMTEKVARIDDAIRATMEALKEGIVAGGGVCCLQISRLLGNVHNSNKDIQCGIDIVKEALKSPAKQIFLNAGLSDTAITKILSQSADNHGYNVNSEKIENFIETGIIDPATVVRVALENALSVAGMFLTCEVSITDVTPTK